MRPSAIVCAALSLAVTVPAGGLLGLLVWDANTPDTGPAQMPDAPGFGLCGLFGMAPVLVCIVIAAALAFVRRDWELYAVLAVGCGLAVGVCSVALAEGAAAALGLVPGQLRLDVVVVLAAAGAYCGVVGSALWWLSRRLRAPRPS